MTPPRVCSKDLDGSDDKSSEREREGEKCTKLGRNFSEAHDPLQVVHLAIVHQGGDAPNHLAAVLIRDAQDLGIGFVAGRRQGT
jgi:hypothetical protein